MLILFVCGANSTTGAYAVSFVRFIDDTQLNIHTRMDFFDLAISSSQRPPQDTQQTQEKNIKCLLQDSSPRFQQSSGFKPTAHTARSPWSALTFNKLFKLHFYVKCYDTAFVLEKPWRFWHISDEFFNVKFLRLAAVISESILIAYFEEGHRKNVIVYTVIITKYEMLAWFLSQKAMNKMQHMSSP